MTSRVSRGPVGRAGLGEGVEWELLEAYLSRIDAHNETLNAIVTLDVERARSAARDADAKRASGAELGPLHGLPIRLKDSYETAGLRTVCGRTDLRARPGCRGGTKAAFRRVR